MAKGRPGRLLRQVAVLLGMVAAVACTRLVDGTGVTRDGAVQRPTVTVSPDPQEGVVPTTRVPVAPGAVLCNPHPDPVAEGATSVTLALAALMVEIAMPATWDATPGADAGSVDLTGPDGFTGSVTATPTDLDPQAAFEQVADDLMGRAPLSQQTHFAAPSCGYSGQRITGTWSETGASFVAYSDRVVHIWTNSDSYLVVVHIEGIAGLPAFTEAEKLMMREFRITIL